MTDVNIREKDPDNVLDLLLEFFGCSEEDNLPSLLRDADEDQLQALLDVYFAGASWQAVKPLPEGEVRPFIETSGVYNAAAWQRGGFPLGAKEFQGKDATWKTVDSIKHRLLYCHSVAVDDPYGNSRHWPLRISVWKRGAVFPKVTARVSRFATMQISSFI